MSRLTRRVTRRFFWLAALTFGVMAAGDCGRTLAASYALNGRRAANELSRIQVSMRVGGDLLLQNEGKTRTMAMSVNARLNYDERLSSVPGEANEPRRSFRYYDRAEATIKLDKGQEKPSLRDSHRLIAAHAGGGTSTLFCPAGPLTREELDLIDVPGNTLVLDDLLPTEKVSVKDSWKHGDETMAALLGLDAVSLTDVESVLAEVTDAGIAKIDMAGAVQGAIGGVSTEIELKAKYEVQNGRLIYFALLIKEKRSIGHVSPGLDVVAKLILAISPLETSEHLSADALAKLPVEPTPEQTRLVFRPRDAAFQLQYDRRWYVTSEERDLAVLRMVQRGELVAQCNLSPLPKVTTDQKGKTMTLDDFQRDVQSALGKRFGQFVHASEANAGDDHVFRVVVQGEQSDLPIRWIYYLIVGPTGDRISLAITLEEKLVDRFGSADKDLVTRLTLTEPRVEQARRTDSP